MFSEILRKLDAQQAIINTYRPFEDADLLREIRDFYRVGIVYSSNAIEGCTYTLSETKILLEDGLTAGGKPLKDAYAVTGLARAYDYMFGLLHGAGLAEEDLLTMHGLLGGGLDRPGGTRGGEAAGGARLIPPRVLWIAGAEGALPQPL